jgi:3-deoxy-7-phosphoheptulonate synthase
MQKMLIVMNISASKTNVSSVVEFISSLDLTAEVMPGPTRTSIGVIGNKNYVDHDRLIAFEGVKEIIHVTKPYKLVSREFKQSDTVVEVGNVKIGGGEPVMIAGPCSVESFEQLDIIAG